MNDNNIEKDKKQNKFEVRMWEDDESGSVKEEWLFGFSGMFVMDEFVSSMSRAIDPTSYNKKNKTNPNQNTNTNPNVKNDYSGQNPIPVSTVNSTQNPFQNSKEPSKNEKNMVEKPK